MEAEECFRIKLDNMETRQSLSRDLYYEVLRKGWIVFFLMWMEVRPACGRGERLKNF